MNSVSSLEEESRFDCGSLIEVDFQNPPYDLIKDWETGFVVKCASSNQAWLLPDVESLNNCFVYRGDLEIAVCTHNIVLNNKLREVVKDMVGAPRKSRYCYLLDNKVLGSYVPYYYPELITKEFGVSTPRGCRILKFADRFQRDEYIVSLEKEYNSKAEEAAGLLSKDMGPNDAVVISDGSFSNGLAASSFFFIDKGEVTSFSSCSAPSDLEKGSLIAEINGAFLGLSYAINLGKKNIMFFFDNSSIVDVFNTTSAIREVVRYKKLITKFKHEVNIRFRDIHPKRAEYREDTVLGANYLHNLCDKACTRIIELRDQGYPNVVDISADSAISASAVIEGKRKNRVKTQ